MPRDRLFYTFNYRYARQLDSPRIISLLILIALNPCTDTALGGRSNEATQGHLPNPFVCTVHTVPLMTVGTSPVTRACSVP